MTARPSGFGLTGPGPLRLYSTAELIKLPPPKWLIQNILPAGGVIGLYAPPGGAKSFVATDWTMCVSSGEPWQGLAVQKGEGLYISAEGGAGMGKRANAWLNERGKRAADVNMAWLIESISVNPDSDSMETLFERVLESTIHPSIIVIDTLARCLEGDENGQEDMGRFIAGVDRMRREFGSAVVIVHHTRLGGDRERGNTAFRGAADTMIELVRDLKSGEITMSCNKQKDSEEFAPMSLKLKVVEGDTPEQSSCVIVPAEISSDEAVLSIWKTAPDDSYSFKEIVAHAKGSGVSLATTKRKLVSLSKSGKIIKENGVYSIGRAH